MILLLLFLLWLPAAAEAPAKVKARGNHVAAFDKPDGRVTAYLPGGWAFPVIAADEMSWYCLKLPSGERCWVRESDVSRVYHDDARDVQVAIPRLDGFDKPAGRRLIRFPQRYHLKILELAFANTKPWYRVDYGENRRCWIPATHPRDMDSQHLVPVPPFPTADAAGNYNLRNHRFWQVVDTDPAGLNARMHPNFPADLFRDWPTSDPSTWPVVHSFARGTVLTSVMGQVGNLKCGKDQAPWLMVEYAGGKRAFVRCNSQFLKPVNGP